MKKISNFLLVGLLILVICSPVLSQDNAPKEKNPIPSSVVNKQSQIFDGPGFPTTVALTTVLPGNFSTSGNGRAPQGSRRFINTKYLITAAEMTTSGFSGAVTSVGWRWNVPSPPAATGPTAQSAASIGNLRVYLRDTVAGVTTFGSTFIDTTGAGYTKVIDGTISIPAGLAEINIDVPVGGPGTGPYTPTPGSAVILIFVYKTTDATLPTPLGSPNICCINSGGPLLTYISQTVGGSTGTASTFRPETRFGSLGSPNDVAVTAINSPAPDAVLSSCPSTKVAPKATFRNVGQLFAAYSATYQITGPAAYTSTRSDTLSPGFSRTLTFDSTFQANIPGTYNVRVFITYPADTSHANDTLVSTFSISNPNFGGGLPANCNYFFANSTACSPPPPASPIFFWRTDTTNSTNLVIDNAQQQAALFTGTLDDGYWSLDLPGTDQIRFCGVSYDSFFVTTNGMIGLTQTNNTTKLDDFTTQSIPSTLAIQPGLFPLWHDFNFGAVPPIVTTNRISYKTLTKPVDGLILVITYDRAPDFGATSPTDYASFQIAIQLNTGVTDGRIIYQYDDSRSGATFLADYFALTLGPQTVGIQDVTGTLGIQYRRVTVAGPAGVIAAGPLFLSPVAVAFGPNAQVLPVELASFTSTVNRRDVTLNWSTATELNNAGFDVERSMVNGQWSMVGNVAGNGTTSSPMNYSFTERNLASGKYNYRLKQIDLNGNFEYFNLGNEVGIGIPTKYDLAQNYPNPFNPTTKINYDIAFDGKVSIKIFDISGREVSTLVNDVQTAGYYTIDFNGSNLSSGAYFYRISADGNGQNFVATKKMVLVK